VPRNLEYSPGDIGRSLLVTYRGEHRAVRAHPSSGAANRGKFANNQVCRGFDRECFT
jgi:hypothetical protein